MKSILTITGVIVLVSALVCTVVQAQKTPAAHDKNVDFSNVVNPAYSGLVAAHRGRWWDVTTGTLVRRGGRKEAQRQ